MENKSYEAYIAKYPHAGIHRNKVSWELKAAYVLINLFWQKLKGKKKVSHKAFFTVWLIIVFECTRVPRLLKECTGRQINCLGNFRIGRKIMCTNSYKFFSSAMH